MNIAECEIYVLQVLVGTGEFRRLGLKAFMLDGREQTGIFVRAWGPKICGRQTVFDLKIAGDSFVVADIDTAIEDGLNAFRGGSDGV